MPYPAFGVSKADQSADDGDKSSANVDVENIGTITVEFSRCRIGKRNTAYSPEDTAEALQSNDFIHEAHVKSTFASHTVRYTRKMVKEGPLLT